MTTMILAFVIMGLVILGMSVGVLLGRKPISGSCGGMSAVGMEGACDVCGGNKDLCEKENDPNNDKVRPSAEFYDVSKQD